MAAKRKYTDEQLAEAKRMDAEGKSRRSIAEFMKLPAPSITRILGAKRPYLGARRNYA